MMQAMPHRRPHPTEPTQTVIDFDAPPEAPGAAEETEKVTAPPAPEYSIAPDWVDTSGKTRTWALKDP